MKKIFILILATSLIFSSCGIFEEKKGGDYTVINEDIELDMVDYENMIFDANKGFIPRLLAQSTDSKILSRTIKIEDGEMGKNILTDSFEIEKGGIFYYPILTSGLENEDFPADVNSPYEYVLGAPYRFFDSEHYGKQLAMMSDVIDSFKFKEIAIEDDKKLTVFEFINKVPADDLEGEAPTMAIRLPNEYKNHIYSYGFEGGSFRNTTFTLDTFIRHKNVVDRRPDYLIFDGDYPEKFDIKGYTNGGLETRIEGLDVEVVKKELGSHELALELFELKKMKEGLLQLEKDEDKLRFMDNTLKFLAGKRIEDRSWDMRLDEVLYSDMSSPRVIYLKFKLKDGDKLSIKKPSQTSFNYCCNKDGIADDFSGYYLMASPDYDTEFIMAKDVRLMGVLMDGKQVNKGEEKNPKKEWKVPKGSDLELMFFE